MFVHYDDVQFDKHGWRNRNQVKNPLSAWPRLVDLDLAIIDWLARELGVAKPQQNRRRSQRSADFGATRYLSGNAARDYLDLPRFSAASVEVIWHD